VPEAPVAFDTAALRAWCLAGADALARASAELDALNVYPVPDGDTGTNLQLTMRAVADAVRAEVKMPLEALAATVSRAALMGAKGNSGVILSQLIRGFSDVIGAGGPGGGRVGAAALQAALDRAATTAWEAVTEPVEGTILSVARAAARAAATVRDDDVLAVARAASAGAAMALAKTTEQLPALAAAGVVDAGGKGLVVLLDSLVGVLAGQPVGDGVNGQRPAPIVDRTALRGAREQGSPEYAFEVMYLLDAPDDSIPGLRARLGALGDSLVVAGGGGLWNVHVHVNDAGAAVEAGIELGRPHRIAVTHFGRQIEDQVGAEPRPLTHPDARQPATGRAVVAICPAGGLAELYGDAGARVVHGVPTADPTADDVLAAILEVGSSELVLLPNDASAQQVADAAAREARAQGVTIAVVPTRASVQGLAALAVHDPQRDFDDDVIAMTAAAGATRHAEVTVADEEAFTSAGVCHPGDVLGFIDGDVAVIGSEVFAVGVGLLDRLLIGGGELVTLVTGATAQPDLRNRLVDYLHATRPAVEAVVYDGGQPRYPLLIGVE
jgi:fatty acid kinase